MLSFFPKKVISVPLNKDNFIDGLVELVTTNGRPITIIDDSGLKKIITPILEAFGLTINRKNIKDYTGCAKSYLTNFQSGYTLEGYIEKKILLPTKKGASIEER